MFHNNFESFDGTLIPLRSLALALTLAGLTGGEFLPLPRSEGGVFPLRSAEVTSKPARPRWVPQRFRKRPSGNFGDVVEFVNLNPV